MMRVREWAFSTHAAPLFQHCQGLAEHTFGKVYQPGQPQAR
jgi:hypothetical protein